MNLSSSSKTDPDARGLECCAVQWDGEDESLGRSVFRHVNDFRQLRSVQSAGGHSRRRLQLRAA